MKALHRTAVIVAVLVVVVTALTGAAQATSQWSRKYNMSCRTCHSTFPRLNYYGQRFMRNGYQDPDNEMPDGDKTGKTQLNDATFIEKLGNYLGVRLNVTPVQYKTNALADSDGERVDQLTLGNTNWAQFFVAGSIAKNMSIFIEMEFTDEKYHYSWYKLGYHNMFGSSLANLIVGNVPARDYGAYPNRLRIFGPIKGDVFNIKSSGGAEVNDESAMNSSGSRPALQYYGYQGPFLVWGGVSPGDNGATSNLGADANDKLHTWGGVRLEVTEDMDWPIEGSAISAWHYQGTDTAGEVPEEEKSRFGPYENAYTRTSVEAEIRAGNFDVMAAYLMGKDENWALDDTDTEVEFSGISVVGGYVQELASGQAFHYGLQYDSVTSDDVPGLETTYLTPSVSYFPRENVRIGLYGRLDMTDGREEDELRHDIMLNIRTMF